MNFIPHHINGKSCFITDCRFQSTNTLFQYSFALMTVCNSSKLLSDKIRSESRYLGLETMKLMDCFSGCGGYGFGFGLVTGGLLLVGTNGIRITPFLKMD